MNSDSSGQNPALPAQKIRLAVIYGGRSGEHRISAATAAGIISVLDTDKYEVIPVGIAPDGTWVRGTHTPEQMALEAGDYQVPNDAEPIQLVPGPTPQLITTSGAQVPEVLADVDVVLPLLHGPFGEDGTIQGLLEMVGVRYVGSGVLASAAGMDKHYMKVVFAAAGLEVGPYVGFTTRQWATEPDVLRAEIEKLTFPLFVKPARAGSSLGITRITAMDELDEAVAEAQRHDPKVIVEQGLPGREIECGVIGRRGGGQPRASLPGEVIVNTPGAQFYDYDSKYVSTEGLQLEIPADVSAEVTALIQDKARKAFEALECEGLARVDFFVDGTDVVVNEINTMPGFTPFSMFPQMWEKSGLSYHDLIDELIMLAVERPIGLR